jgi:AcrR family transcriptional regulator
MTDWMSTRVGRGPSGRPAGNANALASPQASRRERKKQRTRQQILRAALELFAEHGVENVRVEQICERADVARATFFLHFRSRSSLFAERARELAVELAALLVASRGSATAELRAVLVHLASCEAADVTAAALREGCDALRSLCEDIVERGQRRGELRRDVSPQLAGTVLLATAAAVIGERRGDSSPEDAAAGLLAISLRGLIEPKPRLKWSPGRSSGGGGAAS